MKSNFISLSTLTRSRAGLNRRKMILKAPSPLSHYPTARALTHAIFTTVHYPPHSLLSFIHSLALYALCVGLHRRHLPGRCQGPERASVVIGGHGRASTLRSGRGLGWESARGGHTPHTTDTLPELGRRGGAHHGAGTGDKGSGGGGGGSGGGGAAGTCLRRSVPDNQCCNGTGSRR